MPPRNDRRPVLSPGDRAQSVGLASRRSEAMTGDFAERVVLHREASVLECPLRLKRRAAGSFQSLALQEKTGFPFERERVCVCVAVRESCGVACEPFAPTIAPVRGSRQ